MAKVTPLLAFLHPIAPYPNGTPADMKSKKGMKPAQFGKALNNLLANGSTPVKKNVKGK